MSDRRVKYIILASVIFVGIVGISHGQGLFELTDASPSPTTTSLGFLGHVSAVLKDSDGNIIAYQQTDNDIVDGGSNCGSDLVYGSAFSPVTCEFINRIAIGGSSVPVNALQSDLLDKTTNGNLLATLTGVIPTDGGTTGVIETPEIMLFRSFTILFDDANEAIGEAGLFDSNSNMFARTVVGPFSMVSEGSVIEIEWTIEIS